MKSNNVSKIGIIGTGFIGQGLKRTINRLSDLNVSCILTQRSLSEFPDEGLFTNSVQELIDTSDLIVECNGSPVYATSIVAEVLEAGLPVVTMDAELHVTSGSFLASKGVLTEAEGDQPGALAALNRRLVSVGFKPLVYGNLKGFLNFDPTPEEMAYWAKRQGISIEQVTAATDGTKVQIEQAFVANGLGAVIAKRGLYGYESLDYEEGAQRLAHHAKELGCPISDYLLCSPHAVQKFPAGVFITAEFDSTEAETLDYLKLGKGPFYTLLQKFHLIYLDIPLTIREVLRGEGVLLNNSSSPTASVCTIAKKVLEPGTMILRENRNFFVRGEALPILDIPHHVPIGLMYDVVIKQKVEPGQILTFDDIELKETLAVRAWEYTRDLANNATLGVTRKSR